MTNRRDFIKSASFLTLGGLLVGNTSCKPTPEATKAATQPVVKKRIGLQIYSLGKELYADVPAGLKRVGEMGFTTIELAGYREGKIGDIEMSEFKKMSDDAGLQIISTHVNPPVREYTPANKAEIAEFWKKAADDHAKIGVTYLVQPGQPSTRSVEETAFVGEVFNEAGQIAKAAGLSFGYHNHDREFSRVIPGGTEMKFGRGGFGRDQEGVEIVYDVLLQNTDPSLVFFEMDVYWTVMGQQDPVAYMQKNPDRIKLLHIKDKAVLGQSGMMNFENIFKQAYAIGIKDYFVELEGIGEGKQFGGVKGCIEYLQNAPFVK
ncbi:sugar phosphate isomerase/epimerase [Massilibacteroides sp.]|uniref:sugar phosphate isomerase/epimerase family protein n=1 Tax=Massilibacteroides sp. TaxID=2034766 RepID=UPI00262AC962|nr:sugar phosphate isomerase/epimerase [Massilibacteroides sp.]MDD4514037.1 sugar phosphate isomerase/epimerase [Massilibacteroides sp.]